MKDKYVHILGEVNENKDKVLEVSNTFEAREDKEDNGKGSKEKVGTGNNDKHVVGENINMKD